MKDPRKTIIGIFTACVFVIMMMFNVNTIDDGLNISLCGETIMANPSPCNDPADEDEFYYNNSNAWDARNCNISGSGCLTCTVSP